MVYEFVETGEGRQFLNENTDSSSYTVYKYINTPSRTVNNTKIVHVITQHIQYMYFLLLYNALIKTL